MKSISANLNIMIKASDKASKILIKEFVEIENSNAIITNNLFIIIIV